MPTYQPPARHKKLWTDEEIDQLKTFMYETDDSIRQVAEAMERTPMAILIRARIIIGIDSSDIDDTGIAYKDNSRWMDYEDRYLIEQFNAGQSVKSLAKYFDRTDKAIVSRLNKVLTEASMLDKTYQRIRKLRKLSN